MMMMLFDSVEPDQIRYTADGYLVGSAKVARTGIQEYLADELGLTDRDPSDIIRIYRPESEVFGADAMATYAYRPVTIDHPSELVTADTWKSKSSGMTGADVVRDGEYVRVPMTLMDRAAIDQWRSGKRELSMGYTSTIEMIDGVTPEGEKYQGIQRNLKMNHLALVARARGGSQLKLGDFKQTEDTLMTLKTVLVDGLQVETTDAGAQAIEKLSTDLAGAKKALADAVADNDKQIATKDAEIDSLKSKVLDAKALDAAVTARADLIALAKSIADVDYAGKSESEIRQTAVVAKIGDAALAGKSAEYVNARFDILAEDAAKSQPHKIAAPHLRAVTSSDAAYEEMCENLSNAYKGGAK